VLVVGEPTRVLVTSNDRTGNMNLYDNWMRRVSYWVHLLPGAGSWWWPKQLASTRNRNWSTREVKQAVLAFRWRALMADDPTWLHVDQESGT